MQIKIQAIFPETGILWVFPNSLLIWTPCALVFLTVVYVHYLHKYLKSYNHEYSYLYIMSVYKDHWICKEIVKILNNNPMFISSVNSTVFQISSVIIWTIYLNTTWTLFQHKGLKTEKINSTVVIIPGNGKNIQRSIQNKKLRYQPFNTN